MLSHSRGSQAKGQSTRLRYVLLLSLLLLSIALLQVTLLSRYRLFDSVPDLMLCTVVCIGFFSGAQIGAICGIAGGFLIDALGSFGISILPVFYLLCGYVVGHYARAVYPKRITAYAIYAFFSIILREGASLTLAAATYDSVNLPKILLYSVLPESLLTLAMALLCYFPMKFILARIER